MALKKPDQNAPFSYAIGLTAIKVVQSIGAVMVIKLFKVMKVLIKKIYIGKIKF
jgi:hypothetical protein